MGQNCPQNTNYSIYEYTICGHCLPIFWPIVLFFLGIQETISYRLVMRHHDFDAFLKKYIFDGKMSVAASLAPKGLWPQDPTVKLANRVELLGQPLSQKMFPKL